MRFFILLCFALYADIEIVYHIGIMNNWDEIVQEQLALLGSSGLGEACDRISVTMVGPKGGVKTMQQMVSKLSFREKVVLHHAGRDLGLYEFPGIEMVQHIAQEKPNAKILYMHNKGVTHYRKPSEEATAAWRQYMDYFAIERWEDCLTALSTFDACGVEWDAGHKPPHFQGNVWWANAGYIRTCHLQHEKRHDCEFFIGTGMNPNVRCFHKCDVLLYKDVYSGSRYRM
jgi:hypothetical protein